MPGKPRPSRRNRRLSRFDWVLFGTAGVLTGLVVTLGQLWAEGGMSLAVVIPVAVVAWALIWGLASLVALYHYRRLAKDAGHPADTH